MTLRRITAAAKEELAMAQSRSTPSKKPVKNDTRLRFTLEQANRALPYVRRVVQDIVKEHNRAVGVQAAVNAATGTDKALRQTEFELCVDRLQGLNDELQLVGVELKDYATGLVDFVAKHKGRDIYLCWSLGEEKITHFHELSAGFAGRLPVEQLAE